MGKISELLKQLRIESVGQPEGGNPTAVAEELSRKYYVAIAQILRDNDTKEGIAKGLVQLFKTDNQRFDTERFLRAAGIGQPVAEDGDAGFDAWMKKVDAEVKSRSGMSSADLADVPYRDWYDDGVTPGNAARRAIRNAEMGESAGKKDAPKAPMAQQQINKDVDRAARDFEYEKKWGKPRS